MTINNKAPSVTLRQRWRSYIDARRASSVFPTTVFAISFLLLLVQWLVLGPGVSLAQITASVLIGFCLAWWLLA